MKGVALIGVEGKHDCVGEFCGDATIPKQSVPSVTRVIWRDRESVLYTNHSKGSAELWDLEVVIVPGNVQRRFSFPAI